MMRNRFMESHPVTPQTLGGWKVMVQALLKPSQENQILGFDTRSLSALEANHILGRLHSQSGLTTMASGFTEPNNLPTSHTF